MANPRRVLLVEINHDGTVGGSHQALFDLVRQLDPARFTPVVLFYQSNPFVERLRAIGVRVITWDAEWTREHGTRARWWSPKQLQLAAEAVFRRAQVIRRERIDLLHINNSPSYSYYDWLPAARLCRIPIVTHLRGEMHEIKRSIVRRLNGRFDRFISISDYITQVLRNAGMPPARIVQIEDGTDLVRFRARVSRTPGDVRAELDAPAGTTLIVMAGHLRRWKGQGVAIDAVARLDAARRKRIRLVLAGTADPFDAGFAQELERKVASQDLAGSVRFLGHRNDVPDLMSAADVVLHASTSPEPFGLVIVEAMSLGKLVIASASGGPTQIVAPGTGWTFPPGDVAALAGLFERLVDAPELSRSTSGAALARADMFTAERTAARIQALYDELLS